MGDGMSTYPTDSDMAYIEAITDSDLIGEATTAMDQIHNDHPEIEPGTKLVELMICDAWIDRYGNQYYVPSCGHREVAYTHFHESPDDLERKGFIHLSLFYTGYIVVSATFRPTQAQIDKMFDLWNHARNNMQLDRARNMINAIEMFRQQTDAF
jgi:hypothetical protein